MSTRQTCREKEGELEGEAPGSCCSAQAGPGPVHPHVSPPAPGRGITQDAERRSVAKVRVCRAARTLGAGQLGSQLPGFPLLPGCWSGPLIPRLSLLGGRGLGTGRGWDPGGGREPVTCGRGGPSEQVTETLAFMTPLQGTVPGCDILLNLLFLPQSWAPESRGPLTGFRSLELSRSQVGVVS